MYLENYHGWSKNLLHVKQKVNWKSGNKLRAKDEKSIGLNIAKAIVHLYLIIANRQSHPLRLMTMKKFHFL